MAAVKGAASVKSEAAVLASQVEAALRLVASAEYGRVLASVIGSVRDWSIAEDAVQEAFTRALSRWKAEGIPHNPAAWVTTVARRRAIDLVRHESARMRALNRLAHETVIAIDEHGTDEAFPRGDERLQLIFTACHPALTLESRAALTLRTVLNVPVDDLARHFAVSPATMQKRLVRARSKIKHAGIPYRVPEAHELTERSESVCEVLSGLFTLGYADPTLGSAPADEAIRLARLCCQLLSPGSTAWLEVHGMLALLLIQHARREARTSERGVSIPFEAQNRDLWKHDEIAEGLRVLDAALHHAERNRLAGGRHILRAAIAAEYVRSSESDGIDHERIVALYGALERLDGSPFVALNKAIALANAGCPEAALELLDSIGGSLDEHYLYSAARGDVLLRLGRTREAVIELHKAERAAPSERERRSYQQAVLNIEGGASRANS